MITRASMYSNKCVLRISQNTDLSTLLSSSIVSASATSNQQSPSYNRVHKLHNNTGGTSRSIKTRESFTCICTNDVNTYYKKYDID